MNYTTLLEGVLAANGCAEQGRVEYLAGLAEHSGEMWRGYQNQRVAVDYSNSKMQEAYLLRYFWPYSFLIDEVLARCDAKVQVVDQAVNASFFGCGPGPELLSLMRHLSQRSQKRIHINAWMFDLLAREWAHSRKILEDHLFPAIWNWDDFEMNSRAVCVGSSKAFRAAPVSNALASSQLVTFQNCLNELDDRQLERAQANIKFAVTEVPVGATVVLIERSGYANTGNLLGSLFSWISELPFYESRACIGQPEILNAKALKREMLDSDANEIFGDSDGHRERGLQLSSSIKYQWVAATRVAAEPMGLEENRAQ